MNRERLLLAGLASFVAVGSMLLASPEASSSPLTCEHRSAAHLAEHGGKAADDAYHISRGELPNCDDEAPPERRNDNSDANDGIDPPTRHQDNADDEKSRYCKRHFFC